MHAVHRMAAPLRCSKILNWYKQRNRRWEDLQPDERLIITLDLKEEFNSICAYCERQCNEGLRNTIDHFRPRALFPNQTFDWENLVYACIECNGRKADNFPIVSPSLAMGERKAEDYFQFDIATGEIRRSYSLDSFEDIKLAQNTIDCLDLNSDQRLQPVDPSHLPSLRLIALDDLALQIRRYGVAMDELPYILGDMKLSFPSFIKHHYRL